MLFVDPVTLGGKQRHSRRLQPAPAHLQLHQRAGLGLPPAQPEERPSEEALRRPQVRREENRRGSLWLVNPRSGQGARGRWWEVERRGCDWQWEKEGVVAAPPPSWELSMAAADWRLYTTWNMRARDLPEAPATEDRLCVRAYRRISVRMHVWDVRQVDGSLSERMAEAATPPIRWFTINGLICCWFWKHVLSLLIPVKLSWFCSCSLSFATVKFLLFLYSVLMLNCLRWLRVKRSNQAHLFCHCFYVFTKKKETSICVVYQHLMPGVS